jgi:hypothetical protein
MRTCVEDTSMRLVSSQTSNKQAYKSRQIMIDAIINLHVTMEPVFHDQL